MRNVSDLLRDLGIAALSVFLFRAGKVHVHLF
jgi:hypothetical protein